MKNHRFSLPVLFSFAELAWIIVIVFVFIYITHTSQLKRKQNDITKQLEELVKENRHIEEEKNKLVQENDKLKHQNKQLEEEKQIEEKYEKLVSEYNKLIQQNKQLEENCKKLVQEKKQLEENHEKLVLEYNKLLKKEVISKPDEKIIRMEILGLKGDFKKVVVLFDTSESMKDRWVLAKNVVDLWLKFLPIPKCALITFSHSIKIYPEDGSFLDTEGSHSETNRRKILKFIDTVKPFGNTDTFAALEKAYSYKDVDTIILFTDGEPNEGGSFEEITKKIYNLCKKHPNVKVNTVGLGNYFTSNFSNFLINVATETGGTFIGR